MLCIQLVPEDSKENPPDQQLLKLGGVEMDHAEHGDL